MWLTWARGANTIVAAGAPVNGLGSVGAFSQQVVAPTSANDGGRSFGDIAVGPDGQVLVTYSQSALNADPVGPAQLIVQRDPDGLGPLSFGQAIVAADTNVGTRLPIPASAERPVDAEGNLAWDLSDGNIVRLPLLHRFPDVGSFGTDIFVRFQ